MKKALLLFTIVLTTSFSIVAQTSKTINLINAGRLSDTLGTEKSTITNLTVTGNIDQRDFATMKTMINDNTLISIDLSGATIKAYSSYLADVIPKDCFRNSKIQSIIIPTSTTKIDVLAFGECSSITSFFIPVSLISINDDSFYGCDGLTSFSIDGNNTYFSVLDGVLFNKTQTLLIKYPANKQTSTYEIPNTVNNIEISAFENNKNITQINIPNSVTSIENGAFHNCSNLTTINLPNISSLEDNTFSGCGKLNSITIPSSVTSIGSCTFQDCINLSSITFEAGSQLTIIKDFAFKSCTKLTTINLPSSLTTIYTNPFHSCTEITSFSIDASNQNFTTEDGILFNKNKSILFCYPANKADLNYNIPNSVIELGWYAFIGAMNLTNITIPSSITTINYGAFLSCSNLCSFLVDNVNSNFCSVDDVLFNKDQSKLLYYPANKNNKRYTIPNSVRTIESNSFNTCKNLTSLIFPSSITYIKPYINIDSVICYKSTAISYDDEDGGISSNTKTFCPEGSSSSYINAGYPNVTELSVALPTSIPNLVSSASNNQKVAVTSNTAWTASSSETWLTITPSGVFNADITLTATQNTSNQARSAIVTVKAQGVADKTITINQDGATATSIDIEKQQSFKVYPNPTTDKIYIEVEEETLVSLFNQLGQKITTKNISGKDYIDVSSLPKGLYILKVRNKQQKITIQ